MSLLFDLEPLLFPTLIEADRCRDCHRPVAGRWTRHAQGRSGEGYWVLCDACNPMGPVPSGALGVEAA